MSQSFVRNVRLAIKFLLFHQPPSLRLFIMNKETFFKRKSVSTRNDAYDPNFSLDKPVVDGVG